MVSTRPENPVFTPQEKEKRFKHKILPLTVIVSTALSLAVLLGVYAGFASFTVWLSQQSLPSPFLAKDIGCGYSLSGYCYDGMSRGDAEANNMEFYLGGCSAIPVCVTSFIFAAQGPSGGDGGSGSPPSAESEGACCFVSNLSEEEQEIWPFEQQTLCFKDSQSQVLNEEDCSEVFGRLHAYFIEGASCETNPCGDHLGCCTMLSSSEPPRYLDGITQNHCLNGGVIPEEQTFWRQGLCTDGCLDDLDCSVFYDFVSRCVFDGFGWRVDGAVCDQAHQCAIKTLEVCSESCAESLEIEKGFCVPFSAGPPPGY